MAVDYVSIGVRIRHYRQLKCLSQLELAQEINVSRQHISAIELGEKIAGLDIIINIANVLEIPIEDLLTDSLSQKLTHKETEVELLLLDCDEEEDAILTKNMKDLKETLRKYRAK